MAQIDDILSQIQLYDTAARFQKSASQREMVKQQLALGQAPITIDSQDRVRLRVQHLGGGSHMAEQFATDSRESLDARDRTTVDYDNVGLERIVGSDDLLSSSFLKRGAECSKSVCCIRDGESRIGTGFLVCPGVIMTNSHVIDSLSTARRCTAEFNYEDRLIGSGTEASVVYNLDPDKLLILSPPRELDYALVAVEMRSDQSKIEDFGFLKLDPTLGKVLRGESLNIIQHPNGRPKQVAIRQNRFTALEGAYMHYEADTQPGSSGSPVFNDQWQIVCLHHAGVPLKDKDDRILTKNNHIWNNGDDPALIKWIGNEGVRVSRIVADVNQQTSGRHVLLADFPADPPESADSRGQNSRDAARFPSSSTFQSLTNPQLATSNSSRTSYPSISIRVTLG